MKETLNETLWVNCNRIYPLFLGFIFRVHTDTSHHFFHYFERFQHKNGKLTKLLFRLCSRNFINVYLWWTLTSREQQNKQRRQFFAPCRIWPITRLIIVISLYRKIEFISMKNNKIYLLTVKKTLKSENSYACMSPQPYL